MFVQHPGSDEGVWRGKPFAERLSISKEVFDHIEPLKIIGEKRWSEIPVEPWG